MDTHKIIIGDFYANKAREVMCQAYHLNMTAEHGYVWFLPRWFNTDWYNMSLHTGKDREKILCTTEQMLEVRKREKRGPIGTSTNVLISSSFFVFLKSRDEERKGKGELGAFTTSLFAFI